MPGKISQEDIIAVRNFSRFYVRHTEDNIRNMLRSISAVERMDLLSAMGNIHRLLS